MREIKFRAWGKNFDTDTIEMIKPFDLKDYMSYHEGAQHNLCPLVGDYELMQFTGLKDKNGTEIYEGDIVRHSNGIKPVKWFEDFGAWDMGLSSVIVDQEIGYDLNNIEVIGNIYENPDLLKEVS